MCTILEVTSKFLKQDVYQTTCIFGRSTAWFIWFFECSHFDVFRPPKKGSSNQERRSKSRSRDGPASKFRSPGSPKGRLSDRKWGQHGGHSWLAGHPVYVRVTSVTCGGLWSNRISVSGSFLLNFNIFCHCFCRHGVVQNNRKAARLTEFQSSVLCGLQVKKGNCTKIWSFWMLVGHHILGSLVGTSLASGNEWSNGYIAEKKHVVFFCDHWFLLRPVLFERWTRNCSKILYDRWEFSHSHGMSSGVKNCGLTSGTPMWLCINVMYWDSPRASRQIF